MIGIYAAPFSPCEATNYSKPWRFTADFTRQLESPSIEKCGASFTWRLTVRNCNVSISGAVISQILNWKKFTQPIVYYHIVQT